MHLLIVKAAEDAKEDSILTPEIGSEMLAMSEELVNNKTALKNIADGLKETKDKCVQNQDGNIDVETLFDSIVAERSQRFNAGEHGRDEIRAKLKRVLGTEGGTQNMADDDGDGSFMVDEAMSRVNTKCPITLVAIKQAYRNIHCNHVFEKAAVLNYIRNTKKHRNIPKCPNVGCANRTQFMEKDFVDSIL